MKEVGKVTKIDGKFATVTVPKRDECSKCGLCLFPKGASEIELNAENSLGANIGDNVIVESTEKTKFLGVVLAFLVPLLIVGLMVGLSFVIAHAEIYLAIGSLVLIFLWYTILALIDKKFKNLKKFSAVIIKIIHEKGEENE